jgi:hypothetical protein
MANLHLGNVTDGELADAHQAFVQQAGARPLHKACFAASTLARVSWLIGASGSGRRVTIHDGAEEVEVQVDLDGETRVHQRIDVGF